MKNIIVTFVFVSLCALSAKANELSYISRGKCLKSGGVITDTDKRYYMCEGGSYDGSLTKGPATNPSCSPKIQEARDLMQELEDGANNGEEFLSAAESALETCYEKAVVKKLSKVKTQLKRAKKKCEPNGDHNNTASSQGVCYLHAAEAAEAELEGNISK